MPRWAQRRVMQHGCRVLRSVVALIALAGGAGCIAQGIGIGTRADTIRMTTPSTVPSGFPVVVGQSFHDRATAPEMVVIPPGRFTMGSPESETTREGRRAETAAWERPQRTVTLSQPIAVARYFVTVAEYSQFFSATQRVQTDGCNVVDAGQWQLQARRSWSDPAFAQTARHPVTCVTVADAQAYADWLSSQTGHRYRLLHEAEWEYAARAGTTTSRWWGEDPATLCRHANGADLSYDRVRPGEPAVNRRCDDGFVFTNPVEAFPANPFGLHDMLGNLWQWTADCFVEQFAAAPADASSVIEGGDCTRRAIRGGSWHNYPDALRSAARFALPPTLRSASIGFRVVRMADVSPAG